MSPLSIQWEKFLQMSSRKEPWAGLSGSSAEKHSAIMGPEDSICVEGLAPRGSESSVFKHKKFISSLFWKQETWNQGADFSELSGEVSQTVHRLGSGWLLVVQIYPFSCTMPLMFNLYVCVCVCLCMQVCMCVYVRKQVCMCVCVLFVQVHVYAWLWRLENNLGCHPPECHPPLLRKDLSLTWKSHIRQDWLGGKT